MENVILSENEVTDQRKKLEDAELSSRTPFSQYAKLLLVYLVENDTVNARFLWKRIPDKSEDSTPAKVWKLGKYLCMRDFSKFTDMCSEVWPNDLQQLINTLKHRFTERQLALIEQAYTQVKSTALITMLGWHQSEVEEFAKKRPGWEIVKFQEAGGEFIVKIDKRPEAPVCEFTNSDELLKKFTRYAIFFEN